MNYNEVIFNTFQKLIEKGKLKRLDYKSRDIIFKEDSSCDYLCYILDGEVEISTLSYNGGLEVISIIGKNEFFGEYLIFQENNKYLGDVIAKGPVSLIKMDKKELLDLLNQDREFQEAYISFISSEAFLIKQQVKLLSHKNAEDRVIFYLENNSINNICSIPSISSLAKRINLPRETVSRCISKLERNGFLIKDKNTITLLK